MVFRQFGSSFRIETGLWQELADMIAEIGGEDLRIEFKTLTAFSADQIETFVQCGQEEDYNMLMIAERFKDSACWEKLTEKTRKILKNYT